MEQVREHMTNGLGPYDAETIDKALKLLDGVVKNHKNEVPHTKRGDNEKVNNYISSVESRYKDLQSKALKRAKKMGSQVDETVHKRPWYFIAGAAVTGSLLGIFLNNKMRGVGKRANVQ